jgi:tRNA pseudouridine13 synthase
MKVKQKPEDFRVEELTDVRPGTTGEFGFYRLDKTSWTTHDALAAIRRRWKLDAKRLAYGGLKDRHAETTQYLTIFRGPQQDLSHESITLKYLGIVPEPYGPQSIRANRFTIVLRHLTPEQAAKAEVASQAIATVGVPNYFDDQRFGSVTKDRRFIGKEMVLGRFEEALKLALAAPYEHDRPDAKAEKAILIEHWGDWPTCKAKLSRSHARSLVDYLVTHPTDFKGAVARLRHELSSLYLSAYQSYLWNRLLDRTLREMFPASALGEIELSVGTFAVPVASVGVPLEAWHNLALPLLSARLKVSNPTIDALLAEEGLTLPTMKVPGIPKPFFSRGERAACLRIEGVTTKIEDDELNRNRQKLHLGFELPRGSYATMLIKTITSVAPPE